MTIAQEKSTANAGNIRDFRISSRKTNRQRDLSGGIAEVRYYESVLSNNVTLSAAVVETGFSKEGGQESFAEGTIDWLPIRGGERCDIILEDSQPEPNQLILGSGGSGGSDLPIDGMYVNRLRGAQPGTQKDVYFVDFCSKEHFDNDLTRVHKRYDGMIAESVKEIVEEVLEGTWAEGDGVDGKDIDATAVPYNFIGCDKKPFYVCTWLASKSVPSGGETEIGGAAGYFFYQTRDGFHFRSIDKIFEEGNRQRDNRDVVKRFIFNNTGKPVPGYDANIVNYELDSAVDLNEKLTLGSYNNRTIFFDFYAMNYEIRDYNILDQEDKIATAGTDFDNVAEDFTESPSRLMCHILDVGTLASGENAEEQLEQQREDPEKPTFDAPDVMVQSIMRYNQLFTVKTTIMIPGDFSIRAGDVIRCDFPELKGGDNAGRNPQSGGIYMVAEVCHRMTSRECYTSMTLIRDSFGSTSPVQSSSSSSRAGAAVNNDVLFF